MIDLLSGFIHFRDLTEVKEMGAVQSVEGNGRPQITETANFDFRNEHGKENDWRKVPTTDTQEMSSFDNGKSWLEVNRVNNKSMSEIDNFWSERRKNHQIEKGLDVARRLENEKRDVKVYNGRS